MSNSALTPRPRRTALAAFDYYGEQKMLTILRTSLMVGLLADSLACKVRGDHVQENDFLRNHKPTHLYLVTINGKHSFIRWVCLLVIPTLACVSNAAAQSVNPCDNPNNLPSSFFEVPQGPQGTWTASPLPDLRQADDPLVPVVVAMAGAIQGPANRRGMRLGCGILRNRTQTPVTAVQLRWVLVRNEDRSVISQKGYTPDTVLQEGHTPPIELSIPKESFRRTDFSIISFAAVTKDLAKEGILTGDYFLFVGVYEVLFEDGSVWNSGPVLK